MSELGVARRKAPHEERRAALLRDRGFEIAFLSGNYAAWNRRDRRSQRPVLAVARRDGTRRVLLRPGSRIHEFSWMRRGRAVGLILDRDSGEVLLAPDGGLRPGRFIHGLCPASPDPGSDGSRLSCGDDVAYVIRGGRARQVAPNLDGVWDPALSPDGKKVAFVNIIDTGESNLWIFDVRTGRSRQIVNVVALYPFDLSSIAQPSWSPDRKRIAFGASSFYSGAPSVFVVNADGRGLSRIATNGARPAWSPDGQVIAFDRALERQRQIYIMDPDGTLIRQLTHGRAESWAPRWRLRRILR